MPHVGRSYDHVAHCIVSVQENRFRRFRLADVQAPFLIIDAVIRRLDDGLNQRESAKKDSPGQHALLSTPAARILMAHNA